MGKKDIVLVIIFLFAVYIWSLPITNLPFGDVDSSVHFTSGDYMASYDKSIYKLPFYLTYTIPEKYFAYPPQFNTNEAIAQVVGGQRIIPVYLLLAILSSSAIISIYFITRKLYGFLPAVVAAFFMVFSRRDIMYYLWGLWPQTIAFAFFPLIAYSYYKFIDLYHEKKERTKYMVLTILLIAISYTFHPQMLFLSVAFIFIYSAVLFIKNRKLPFKIKDISILVFLMLVFVILLAPFQFKIILSNLGVGGQDVVYGEEFFKLNFDKVKDMVHWFKFYDEYTSSVPESYFSYSYIYGGFWTLPLLILGLITLLIRRKKQDLLILSFLITLYLFLHMDVLGGDRNFRFLQIEAQLFSILIAIGLITIPSFFKLPKEQKTYLKYGVVVIFIILALFFNAQPVISELKQSYQGITRLSQAEYDAALWMRENLPEESHTLLVGTVAYNKKKWLHSLAFKHVLYDNQIITTTNADTATHVLVDYSDFITLGQQDAVNQLQQWEANVLANATLIYPNEIVRVYSLETK